jgi:hypothetical protein
MADALALLTLLIGLELVLGIDNILVISIFVGRLPESHQNRARATGLALALVARVAMLFLLLTLANLTNAIVFNFSVRDIILLAGGLFLLFKAVREIHHTVELKDEEQWHFLLTSGILLIRLSCHFRAADPDSARHNIQRRITMHSSRGIKKVFTGKPATYYQGGRCQGTGTLCHEIIPAAVSERASQLYKFRSRQYNFYIYSPCNWLKVDEIVKSHFSGNRS